MAVKGATVTRALLRLPLHALFETQHLGLYKTKLVLCIGKAGTLVAPEVRCLREFLKLGSL